jgi:ribonuclease P protein subunit RPR2
MGKAHDDSIATLPPPSPMAKKEKEETPNVNATQNRDIAQRLNFLYQASVYLQSIAPPTNAGLHSNKGKQHKEPKKAHGWKTTVMDVDVVPSKSLSGGPTVRKHRRKISQRQTTGDLARSYIQSLRIVGQKTTVKM